MNKRSFYAMLGSLLALAIHSHVGIAQQPGPTVSKGVVNKVLGAIDLGPEIEGMAGRQLRIRMVTIEPGGVTTAHGHTDRPTVEYVVQGKIIEHRGGVSKEYGPGDFVTANKDVTHYWENKGATPVVLLPVDIFKP